MSNGALCRVCLARDIKMHHIANTRYQEIFEKLSTKLYTADQRPATLCYICFSHLRRCCQFAEMSRKAEIILTQISMNGIQATRELNLKMKQPLCLAPIKYLFMSNTEDSTHGTFGQEVISVKGGKLKVESFQDTVPDSSHVIVKEEMTSIEEEETAELLMETEPENIMASERCNIISECLKFEVDSDYAVNELPPTKHVEQPKLKTTDSGDISSRTFSVKRGLALQTQMPYSCNFCEKKFHQKGQLRVHIRVHTGEKPYACDICDKKFNQTAHLMRHMRVHTGEKPYACDICHKYYSDQTVLTRHQKIHTKEKPYTCDTCGLTFNQKSSLKRHNGRIHFSKLATQHIQSEIKFKKP